MVHGDRTLLHPADKVIGYAESEVFGCKRVIFARLRVHHFFGENV